MAKSIGFPSPTGALRQPDRIDTPGLLVGWSTEDSRRKPPVGFNTGNPEQSPHTGFVDPILMDGDGHLITIAPTGAGKGVGAIIPALLRFPGQAIVIDPKGENCAVTADRRRKMGQRVVIIDPMRIVDLGGAPPDQLDPLDLIDLTLDTAADDVSALVSILLPETGADKDKFWIGRARHILTGLILHAKSLGQEGAGLPLVRKLLALGVESPRQLAEELKKSKVVEASSLRSMLGMSAQDTITGMVATAQEGVDFVRGQAIETSLSRSTFQLEDLTRGQPMTIYLVLPPAMLESHAKLLQLWVSALITAILRRRRKPDISTLFLLDEAAQLGRMTQLRQAITLLRGYGLQTWSFWQDVSQLKSLYPTDWPTMINNCSVVQAFGAYNSNAARSMAELVGYPDANGVLDLAPDEMLLQVARRPCIIAQRPDYRTDPAFADLYTPNPMFLATAEPPRLPRTAMRLNARRAARAPLPTTEADASLYARIVATA